MISLLTCHNNPVKRKGSNGGPRPELEEVLHRLDGRVRGLYDDLPSNALLIICTGHGDTAIVRRLVHLFLFLTQREGRQCEIWI